MTRHFIPGTVLASLIATGIMTNPARADAGAACEAKWLANSGQFVNKETPDYAALLSYWQEQSECMGTGAYEARLAGIYLYLDEPEKARAALSQAKKAGSDYSPLIELIELVGESFQLTQPPIDESVLNDFTERVYGFADRNPEFAEGVGFAGGVQTATGHHARAIPLLEKAIALAEAGRPIARVGLLRNATISYAALKMYSKAYDAAGEAAAANKAVMADPEFMYAVIKTQAELGYLKEAKTAAQVLVAKTPLVRTDPEFHALVADLEEKLEAAAK